MNSMRWCRANLLVEFSLNCCVFDLFCVLLHPFWQRAAWGCGACGIEFFSIHFSFAVLGCSGYCCTAWLLLSYDFV